MVLIGPLLVGEDAAAGTITPHSSSFSLSGIGAKNCMYVI
jgi:hypothetical protein